VVSGEEGFHHGVTENTERTNWFGDWSLFDWLPIDGRADAVIDFDNSTDPRLLSPLARGEGDRSLNLDAYSLASNILNLNQPCYDEKAPVPIFIVFFSVTPW
jgi:hypothetical protein